MTASPHMASDTAQTRNLDYIRRLYATQDALLAEIDATLHKKNIAIHINPEEGKLLQMLVAMHGVKSIVEVGTLAGYSAIWMARALPDDGRLYAINRDPEHIKMAQGFFDRSDVGQKITQLEGDAHDVLATLDGKGPYDMVFIDADKESYLDYLDWAEKNIRKGGLIIADNTLLFDTVALDTPPASKESKTSPTTWKTMRIFNELLANQDNYYTTMINTDDGLTIALKLF